ncbi:DUF853 domain-containing protein [Aureimonas fodinaquatilis]|uniref:DUF853 domain-containing protein n=1 Tax=Aureimonas fodinaquatilis TaxID=2565783 RepID=A0A5B0E0Z1_9HYPH|nr:helicase HerA-like C-terminal domain-containing protein [Aureimonas fodinaquatilis]KAA0972298.1 DUF853 domain-containing protein [Aureimonas fodinaquatilis]
MQDAERLLLGATVGPDGPVSEYLDFKYANRHGIVTGATGTGKTVTLQVLAEGFSNAGVPVFCADIKGDLSGLAEIGEQKDFLVKRAQDIGLNPYTNDSSPVIFWDLFGEKGHRVRTTISEMGPLLLSRLMNLTEAQEGVLNIAFRIADEEGLLLLDLKDLQAILGHVAERADELSRKYGNVGKASVGAIQRQLLILDNQGASFFFGEPALSINDLMRTDRTGKGIVSVLAADKLMNNPRLYATFLLWLLSEMFEELPEVGDLDKPRLVFFFDEAHLLFDDAPKALVDRIEQVVKLIRSKGVGVYFVTQNPLDVPESVLAQLGNRIQHALRAYTPREEKAVKTAADTFRPNPEFNTFRAITELGVGEALVSTLGKGGVPSMVQRCLIRPPAGRIGPVTDAERQGLIQRSPVFGVYDRMVDRESAYELLEARAAKDEVQAEQPREDRRLPVPDFGREPAQRAPAQERPAPRPRAGYQRQTVAEAVMKQVGRTVATTLTTAILRGVLGSLKRGK